MNTYYWNLTTEQRRQSRAHYEEELSAGKPCTFCESTSVVWMNKSHEFAYCWECGACNDPDFHPDFA